MNNDISRRELLGLAVLVEGGLAVIACLAGWWLDMPPWRQIAFTWMDVGLGFAASLPMLAVFFGCLRWPWGPWRDLANFAGQVIQPLFRHSRAIDLLLIGVLAGIGEEWLFRGLIQTWLGKQLGSWWALALASVLFGLFHPFSVFYVFFAASFGFGLGALLLLRDHNLLAPTIAHAVYDFVALACIIRGKPAGTVQSDATSG